MSSNDGMRGEPSFIRDPEGIGGDLIDVLGHCYLKEVDKTRIADILMGFENGIFRMYFHHTNLVGRHTENTLDV